MVLLYGSYASFLLAPQFPDQNAEMPARGNSRHHIGHVLSAASSWGKQGRFQPMFCAGDVIEHTLEKADPPGAACRFSCREKRICFATSIQGQQGGRGALVWSREPEKLSRAFHGILPGRQRIWQDFAL